MTYAPSQVVAGVRTLMRTEGPRGLYRGYFATISRDVPWNALSFMFFAQTKSLFKSVTGEAPTAGQVCEAPAAPLEPAERQPSHLAVRRRRPHAAPLSCPHAPHHL